MMLETGASSQEALSLYRRHRYGERGPFGAYQAGPHTLFMEKWPPLEPTGSNARGHWVLLRIRTQRVILPSHLPH
jgi:hypothetical protein